MAILDALKALRQERSRVAHKIVGSEDYLKDLQLKLEGLDKAISTLEAVYEPDSGSSGIPIIIGDNVPGITEAVRTIFRSNYQLYFVPTAIRDALKKEGLIKGYDNEMAVIHQVIRRLELQGQIEADSTGKAYCWKNQVGALTAAARRLGRERFMQGPDGVKK